MFQKADFCFVRRFFPCFVLVNIKQSSNEALRVQYGIINMIKQILSLQEIAAALFKTYSFKMALMNSASKRISCVKRAILGLDTKTHIG